MWGLPLTVVMLFFPAPTLAEDLMPYSIGHLAIIQLASVAFAARLAIELSHPWFAVLRRPWLASAASLVALVTGFAALMTLASSAAARYDVSLQFLQLLSSIDIAWVAAALLFGGLRLWSSRAAWIATAGIIAACIGSIAIYLAVVGFTGSGGWLVSGADLMKIVIPADVVAAIVAIGALLVAAKRADPYPTAQRRPQS